MNRDRGFCGLGGKYFLDAFPAAAILAIVFVLSWAGSLRADTNQAPCAPISLFSTPAPSLRPIPEIKLELPAFSQTNLTLAISTDFSLDAVALERTADDYTWVNSRPFLTQDKREELGGFYGWAVQNVLELDVVRYKSLKMTGSIVTAWKRKNPLYLLNPVVFWAAW
jgi:hypothetical protein